MDRISKGLGETINGTTLFQPAERGMTEGKTWAVWSPAMAQGHVYWTVRKEARIHKPESFAACYLEDSSGRKWLWITLLQESCDSEHVPIHRVIRSKVFLDDVEKSEGLSVASSDSLSLEQAKSAV